MNQTKIASLAGAAALFALSAAAFAADSPAGSSGAAIAASDKVHCYGVHDCKGNADCKTGQNACKGTNACKGHSFKSMTAKACLDKGGVIADVKPKG